jgi:hypothetical protein
MAIWQCVAAPKYLCQCFSERPGTRQSARTSPRCSSRPISGWAGAATLVGRCLQWIACNRWDQVKSAHNHSQLGKGDADFLDDGRDGLCRLP